jgi:molybdenum cofactor cytidylyltransferase
MTEHPTNSVFVGALILGAGKSARMGRPKLLLPWAGTTVLGHLIQQWNRLGVKQIALVSAVGDTALKKELDRLEFPIAARIHNPEPERGMFSSIQCAASWPGWNAVLTHWAIVLGDQPHLRENTLRAVLDFSAAHPQKVCSPKQHGHRRHPVMLPRIAFERLAGSGAANLREFLLSCEEAHCDLQDPGLELDIDHPQDYEKALKLGMLYKPVG